LAAFFLAVSSWRFRPLLGGKPARPAQPSQRRRRSVLPSVPVHCDRLHLELVAARAREMFYHSQIRFYALPVCGVRFLRPRFFIFITNLPSSPHTSSHMFGHHPATVRLARRKRHARFESSEALAELPAVARTAVGGAAWMLRQGVASRLQRRSSANILTTWPGRVAQAPRAGRARAP